MTGSRNGDTAEARTQLRALVDVAGQLGASLLVGTARPYRAPAMSTSTRARLDREARIERLERTDIAPGDSPDPYDFEVSDLLFDIFERAEAWWARACLLLWRPQDPPAFAVYADPRQPLGRLDVHLWHVAVADPVLTEQIAAGCHQLVERAQGVLGNLVDGQLLTGVCPSCHGRTAAKPAGGARTLRIRLLPGSPGRPVVVCESGRCDPDSAHCGIRWKGLPAWDLDTEGAWLAKWIEKTAQLAAEGAA